MGVSRRELSLLTIALLAGAAAVLGWHVARGGFYSDDWSNAAGYHFGPSPRYFHAVSDKSVALGARPLLAVLLPIPHALFGVHPAPQLVLALLLAVAMCVSFFLFLRTVGIGGVDAGVLAGLALVFPWSDSTVLWATASLNSIAVSLAFLGAAFALHAAARAGRLGTVGHVVAVVLFVASVLTYEVAAVPLLLVGAFYLRRGPRRRALRWWLADVVAVGGALVYTALTTEKDLASVGDRIHAAPTFVRQAVDLFSLSFVPPGLPHTAAQGLQALAVLVTVAVVALAVRRLRRRLDGSKSLRSWLALAAATVVGIAAAYAVFLGSYLMPLDSGIANHVNILAAFGYVTLVYCVLMMTARLVGARSQATATVVAAVLVLLVGAGYVSRVVGDESAWNRASRLQAPILDVAARAASTTAPGSTIVTFAAPADVRDGIPIFDAPWDLDGAIQLRTHDHTVHAYPVYAGTVVSCDPHALSLVYPNSTQTYHATYPELWFVSIKSGRREPVRSAAACRAALERFSRGTRELESGGLAVGEPGGDRVALFGRRSPSTSIASGEGSHRRGRSEPRVSGRSESCVSSSGTVV